MTTSNDRNHAAELSSTALTQGLESLLLYGTAMLRAGDTAFRVRDWMRVVAGHMGIDALAVQITLGGIAASVRRGSETATVVREIGPPGVNVWRIGALEEIARTTQHGITPRELDTKLAAIEASPPHYSIAQTCAAISVASAAFAFVNGGTLFEVTAAAVAGGIGQCLRTLLLRRRFNQYAISMLCTIVASGLYCLIAAVSAHAGFGVARHTAGLISSVLFLVPGFPVIAALLDLLQHQTAVALQRLAYGTMIMLVAAIGLCVVTAVVGLSIDQPPAHLFGETLTIALRGLASFGGACGFAILFNSATRILPTVGMLALAGNELRLVLHDAGMMLPAATFLGALTVGLLASLARRHLNAPRIALTVPGIIMMVPGFYAFQAIVLFAQGAILPGLKSVILVGFIIGAMAGGLAVARFLTERKWLRE